MSLNNVKSVIKVTSGAKVTRIVSDRLDSGVGQRVYVAAFVARDNICRRTKISSRFQAAEGVCSSPVTLIHKGQTSPKERLFLTKSC